MTWLRGAAGDALKVATQRPAKLVIMEGLIDPLRGGGCRSPGKPVFSKEEIFAFLESGYRLLGEEGYLAVTIFQIPWLGAEGFIEWIDEFVQTKSDLRMPKDGFVNLERARESREWGGPSGLMLLITKEKLAYLYEVDAEARILAQEHPNIIKAIDVLTQDPARAPPLALKVPRNIEYHKTLLLFRLSQAHQLAYPDNSEQDHAAFAVQCLIGDKALLPECTYVSRCHDLWDMRIEAITPDNIHESYEDRFVKARVKTEFTKLTPRLYRMVYAAAVETKETHYDVAKAPLGRLLHDAYKNLHDAQFWLVGCPDLKAHYPSFLISIQKAES